MIINNNLIIADEGYLLRRVINKQVVGKEYLCGYIYYDSEGQKLDSPYLESSIDFEEISKDDVYGDMVTKLIRECYTISDELAIQRQRDTKPDAFQKYFDYCEMCKKRAWKELENL